MTHDPNIQTLDESDLLAVRAIERRVMPFGWSIETFRSCLHNSAYECWKLVPNETLIGYCILYFVSTTAQLLNLCIDTPYQGKGYGRDLLCFAVARCQEKEVCELFLEVRESNTTASSLYLTQGFEKIDQRRDYYECSEGREHADVLGLKLV